MSVNKQDQGAPILPGSSLARALDDFAVPGLSAGFADRVLAAAEARPAPLPELRRASGGRSWRMGRRIVIGVASFGALATAAAATGLLQRLDLAVPSAGTVWASIAGPAAAAPAPAPPASRPVTDIPATPSMVEIVGPIDTPEELGEAFRRIDEVRAGRREERRRMIDQRIEDAIERRRAAGLPDPSPEEEERFRQRVEAAQTRRQQVIDEQVKVRREQMQRKVESGEALTREEILRPLREDQRALQRSERIEKLRQMSPEQRREALRLLPPAERRALIEQYRAQRAAAEAAPTPAPAEPPEPATQTPSTE
ncbi:MAG: hypothetical protein EAY70_11380 [Sphingomonadales bacterium]|nr:MAG: hypothetical protein EAY70_11380 [Sphingomonadales bacterium]